MKNFALNVKALVLKRLTGDLPSYSFPAEDLKDNIDFPLADPFFNKSSKIDMLIGADLYPSIILDGLKNKVLNTLMAQNTVFGWVLLGPIDNTTGHNITSYSTFVSMRVLSIKRLKNFGN